MESSRSEVVSDVGVEFFSVPFCIASLPALGKGERRPSTDTVLRLDIFGLRMAGQWVCSYFKGRTC